MAVYRQVRALARGLELIRILNSIGSAPVQQLSQLSGIHRTTVYRLLETMQSMGYIALNESDGTYRATGAVRFLSNGYFEHDWMREVAYPQMARLARTIIWPMNLLTPAGETMLVRESTHHLSPVSIHRSMIGTRWPYMVTSFGRAYLAYCTDQERSELLRLLVGSSLPGNRLAGNPRSVATLIERTRRDGYGSTLEEVVEGFSSIAVPIHVAGRTVGCLNTIFFTSVFTPAKAAEKFLAPLKETVSIIQEEAQQYVD